MTIKKNHDRVALLRDAYVTCGLDKVLEVQETKPMDDGRYTKMLFRRNDFAVSSWRFTKHQKDHTIARALAQALRP